MLGLGLSLTDRHGFSEGPAAPLPAALRLMASVDRGITPITQVMAAAPTFGIGTGGAASTINGEPVTDERGTYQPEDSTIFDHVSGRFVDAGSAVQGQGMVNNISGSARKSTAGNGLRFLLTGTEFDYCSNGSNHHAMIYVTDPVTRVRERVAANDLVGSASFNSYHKLTFASPVEKIVEIKFNSGSTGASLRGFNASGSLSKPPADPAELRIALVGDSHGNHAGSGATNPIALAYPDFLGERLGTANIWCLSNGGTGFLNAATSLGTYRQRIAAGDLDEANCGVLDLVMLSGTTNDDSALNGAWTDAALAAEVQLTVSAAMSKQSSALIAVWGPHVTQARPLTAQSRYDAMKTAVSAAAAGDPRVIWLDNSPSGMNWMNAGNLGTLIGPDGVHWTNAGMSTMGHAIGDALIAAVAPLAGRSVP